MIYRCGALYIVEIILAEEVESGQHHRWVAYQEPVGTNFRSDGIDIKGKNCTYVNSRFQGIDDYGRGIRSFRRLPVISHATCKVPRVW